MKSNISMIIGTVMALIIATTPAFGTNGSMMDLLKILRDKGTLTQSEYELLVNASKADEERIENVKTEAEPAGASKQMEKAKKTTGWTSKVKIKGDIRLRYEWQDTEGSIERNRGRYRARFGIIGRPVDNWETGIGVASGGDDPRSTNETFDDTFETKDARMDYAYLQYKKDNLMAIGGKFKRKKYLWNATDVMWDGDINPEGFATKYSLKNGLGKLWIGSGILVIDEGGGDADDPYMIYAQVGQNFKRGNMYGKIAAQYHTFGEFEIGEEHSAGTNTDDNLGTLGFSWELGTKIGRGKVALIGDYFNNIETSTNEDSAYAVGFNWKNGPWKAKYVYAKVDHNAVPDFLPDSDRFNGNTGIKGHEFEVGYKINKKTSLGLDFYATEDDDTGVEQEVLQLDVKVKF
ncbi:MAG: putative porin [Pseudomonadota bacterium]|nr:putative porin [Pseudomonadota bacterium]